MLCMPLPNDTLARRVAFARKERGMTQAGLAKASGLKQPDISKIELGLIQKTTGIARLAQALGVPVDWLEQGLGAEPVWSADDLMFSRNFPPGQQIRPYTPVSEALALHKMEEAQSVYHAVSHRQPIIQLQELSWEDLVGAKIDGPFQMHIPGDELAPAHRRGELGRFTPGAPPRPGRPVLLRDDAGAFHLRLYREGAGGSWEGYSEQPGFKTLESDAHGVEIVAPMTGSDWG